MRTLHLRALCVSIRITKLINSFYKTNRGTNICPYGIFFVNLRVKSCPYLAHCRFWALYRHELQQIKPTKQE